MAQTYTSGRNLFGTLTDNAGSDNLTLGDTLINSCIRQYCAANGGKWWFLEKVTTQSTVNGQAAYILPQSTRKIMNLYVTVGSTVYTPIAVEDAALWARILQSQLGTGDRALFYYRQGNQVFLAPTPGSDGNTITIRTRRQVVDLRNADYTTGTVTATLSDNTVDGAGGASFTAAMVGRYLNVTNGDGIWYEIASRTDADTIELVSPYEGATVAASAYTIGELSALPIDYQEMPIYKAASIYWAKEDSARSRLFADMALEKYNDMVQEAGEKVEGDYMFPVSNMVFRDPNIPEPSVNTSSFT